MTKAHIQAHPMIEPLDYSLTPDLAGAVLAGEALDVYRLLWNAALATAAEGPVIRRELLGFAVSGGESEPTAYVQVRSATVIDPGWLAMLPAEAERFEEAEAASIPPVLDAALAAIPASLDGNGGRARNAEQCAPLLPMISAPAAWECNIVDASLPGLRYDSLIESMAEQGVGRPSTYAGRLQQSIANGLIEEGSGGFEVGAHGAKVLGAMAGMPGEAVIDASFCAQLEARLEQVERDPGLAGSVLSEFCRRALGQDTGLANWLDALPVEGEDLLQTLQRNARALPEADSWEHAALPPGLTPWQLVRDPETAAAARAEFDALLAAADMVCWKAYTARQRAVRRLAVIAMAEAGRSRSEWAMLASRDVAWRWWLDLGPDQPVLAEHELLPAERDMRAAWEQHAVLLASICMRLKQVL